MTLLSRVLHRLPLVQRLEKKCDRLRFEQNSALLGARTLSAKMGVLDAQVRTMQNERVREAENLKNLTAEHQRTAIQFRLASEACDALTKERDTLVADRGAIMAQRDEAIHSRDQLAREVERYRQDPAPGLPTSHDPLRQNRPWQSERHVFIPTDGANEVAVGHSVQK